MEIIRNGKTTTIDPGPSYSGNQTPACLAGIWESYLTMIEQRPIAIAACERRARLLQLIADHPGHPNNVKAYTRIWKAEDTMRKAQLDFLYAEQVASQYWRLIPKEDRQKENLHEMFNCTPDATTISGAWHKPLGDHEGAPLTCPMDQTVLMFCWPETARNYQWMRRPSSQWPPRTEP